MMHKDKSKRHQSWRDLVTNLKEELHSEPQDKKLLIRKHPTEPRIKLKTSNQKNPSK
jgi:hypothetical protein